MSISLCMIIKDESKLLKSFFESVKNYVDEIIVVDTGSKDNSKEIAKRYGKVFDFEWIDDFSSARNFSISKATKDWILWLDPDEEISDGDFAKIGKLVDGNEYMGFRFVQETVVNGKKYVQGICKLFRNFKGIEFVYPIHESVMPSIKEKNGKIGKSGIVFRNKSNYDLEKAKYYLELIEKKMEKYPESSAEKERRFIAEIIENYEEA